MKSLNISVLNVAVSVVVGSMLHTTFAMADATDAVPAVQAQWQPRELNFYYKGFSTLYSCSGIEERLERLLRDLGARPDVRVSAVGCQPPMEVSSMISARIRANMPVEAAASDQGASFPAQRKVVTLTTLHGNQVGAGDCELLEQVGNQLVPALKLEVVKNDLHCVPGQAMIGNRGVQVSALVPLPAPKDQNKDQQAGQKK